MVARNGLKLAVHIIESSFGDLVAKVCDCLLHKGTLSLQQIIKYTELSRDQVSNSLLVLIQHNCVQAFALEQQGGFGEASKVQTQYTALFDQIIHRMRFPKFLATVHEELDQQCSTVFGKLLQHGRLTLSQISEKAHGNPAAPDFRGCLIKLLHAHYIERCPVGEPFLPLSNEEAPARKRGAKSGKIVEELETTEKRALLAAAPMDALRFSLRANTTTNDEENGRDGSLGVSVGEKRKHDTLESDKEPETSQSEREILWRANFEKFLRRLRHKACIENVRSRLDDGATIVLNAILKATANADLKVKADRTVPLSLNNIFEEVMKSEMGRTMTIDHVRPALGQLGCHPGGVTGDLYSIDLKSIIHLAQNDEVESAVLKKYGKDAYRIFRLLSKSSRLMESNKISDATFVEKKDAAKILFRLWKDNYLHMEKLAVQGSSNVFLLWKTNKPGLWEHVLDDMYHSALNLRIRKADEVEKESEILGVAEERLYGKAKEKRVRVEKMKLLLDSCLMKLDDAIMLFHDF